MRAALVGDCLLDVSAVATEPMRLGGDVPASVRLAPGGQAANIAVRLARRGVDVELVSPLGDDAAGAWLWDALRSEGVTLRALRAARTGGVVIVTAADGERSMLSERAAFPPDWGGPLRAALAAADVVCCSGYALLDVVGDGLAAELGARPPGLALVLAGCAIPPDAADAFAVRLHTAGASLLVLNRDEAATLAGGDAPAASLAGGLRHSVGSDIVVVTDGPRPAAAALGDDGIVEPHLPEAAPAVDTTGAGDAYVAALIAELAGAWPPDGTSLAGAMIAAARVAGAVAATVGAQARVPGERPPAVTAS